MAVDLSMVGIQGQLAGQQILTAQADREALKVKSSLAIREAALEDEELALDRLALGRARAIAAGEGVDIGSGTASTDDMGRFLQLAGEQYMAGGAPKRGREFVEASMSYRKDEATLLNTAQTAQKTRLDNMLTVADYVSRNIGENESEFRVFLADMGRRPDLIEILGQENFDMLKNQEWSPELAGFYRSKALSVKDQAELDLKSMGEDRQERSLADLAGYRQQLARVNQENLTLRRQEAEQRAKVDGPKVDTAPTPSERTGAQRAIISQVPALKGKLPDEGTPELELLNHMTEDIVGRAKTILTENRGLGYNEAVNRAVAESVAAGDFTIVEASSWFGSDKPTYQRSGIEQSDPAPLPEDRSKLVRGRYYESNGKVGRYGYDFE